MHSLGGSPHAAKFCQLYQNLKMTDFRLNDKPVQ